MPRHAIHLGTAWEPPTAEAPVWVRRFGRPAGVEPGDRLVLVCERVTVPAVWSTATINGRSLAWHAADAATLECEVTAVIADRNALTVPVASGDPAVAGDATPRSTLPPTWGRLSLVIVSD